VIDNISWGWFLFRLAKGAHMSMEQVRVNDEVWLPRRLRVALSGRVGLVKRLNMEQDLTFRNFRKLQSDSKVIPEVAR